MAQEPLVVILSPRSEDDLLEIWGYSLERYGLEHAEAYENFLKKGINALAETYTEGGDLADFPEYKFVALQKSRRGDGHYVIYRLDRTQGWVRVPRILHTKMDVLSRLADEP